MHIFYITKKSSEVNKYKKLVLFIIKEKKESLRVFPLKTHKKPSYNFITACVHVGALTTMVVLSNDGV